MAKLTLTDIGTGYSSTTAMNANHALIEAALENTISRDGTSPNSMSGTLDMNGNNILNQGNPITIEGWDWEGPWVTSTVYTVGDVIETGGSTYICIVAHTSGTFSTDLTAVKWQLVATASLPSQSGNSGKHLTTNGTVSSWDDLSGTWLPLAGGAVTGNLDLTGTELQGAAPLILQGATDHATNKITVNVTDPTAANAINIPDLSTMRIWNMPAGIGPIPYAGSSIPTGWLECDGSAVSRTTYAALFSALSTTWGVGNGSSTFNLPNMKGRSFVGAGTGAAVEDGNESDITLAADTLDVATNVDKWVTGMKVTLNISAGTITGVSTATNYYVIRNNTTTIKLATTLALAQAGTAIDLTAKAASVTWDISYALSARTLGATGGEEGHAMSSTELLAHTHPNGASNQVSQLNGGSYPSGSHNPVTGTTGGNAAMNVMNPFVVTKMIISY